MTLYVYAIVERPCDPPAEWRGLAEAPLSTVSVGSLAAVVSEIDAAPPRDTAAFVCHEALIEALGVHHRTLPVRFGTVFSDASTVADALSERYESLASDLVRIGDKVELGVLALWRTPHDEVVEREPSASSGGTGARYLQARRSAYARADAGKAAARQLAHEVDVALHAYALDRRITTVNEGGLAFRAAYLVAPTDVSAIRDVIDEIRRRRSDVAIALSGPWPPYSFVSSRPGTDVEPPLPVPHAR